MTSHPTGWGWTFHPKGDLEETDRNNNKGCDVGRRGQGSRINKEHWVEAGKLFPQNCWKGHDPVTDLILRIQKCRE